jgi:penicillin V acylase-like amidase (Ntn superfamily)
VVEVVKGVKVVHRGKDTVVMTNEPALDWKL